jgi:hypothetical protein
VIGVPRPMHQSRFMSAVKMVGSGECLTEIASANELY